jgi:hypothetical protein
VKNLGYRRRLRSVARQKLPFWAGVRALLSAKDIPAVAKGKAD